MSWPPDVPDVPFYKPKEIELIESMDSQVLESMPGAEVDEWIDNAAYALAKQYHEQLEGTYEDCIDVVSMALNMTGSAVGGNFGRAMIGAQKAAAKSACRIVFKIEDELNP